MTSASPSFRGRLQGFIPITVRETLYRVIAGGLTFLTGWGILDNNHAVLWSQLGVGTVTALFALLYATSSARVALYALIGPVGAVVMAYGILNDAKWAVIVASLGQVFGTATAAAKVVELHPSGVAVAVSSPREARSIRRTQAAKPRRRRAAKAKRAG